MKKDEQEHRFENLEADFVLKFNFLDKVNLATIKSNFFAPLSENNFAYFDRYKEGERKFNEAFAKRPFAMRNIALNLLMNFDMPIKNKDYGLFENYCYYAAAFSMIKFAAAAIFYSSDEPEYNFKIQATLIDREFGHNKDCFKKVLDIYKEMDYLSFRHIFSLVK